MGNKIIVCPLFLKRDIILNSDPKEAKSFLTERDLEKGLAYQYDLKAIYLAYEEYAGKNYPLAKRMVEAAASLDIKDASLAKDNEKITALIALRDELVGKKLFYKDEIFLELIRNNQIVLVGYEDYSGLQKALKEAGCVFTTCPVSNFKKTITAPFYRFKELKEEGEETLSLAACLLKQGAKPYEIGICVRRDYMPFLRSLALLGGLELSFDEVGALTLPDVKKALADLKDGNLEIGKAADAINGLAETGIKKAIADFASLKGLPSADKLFCVQALEDKLGQVYLDRPLGVEMTDQIEDLLNKKHVFFLGVDDSYPKVRRDDGFLTDQEKATFTCLETSYSLNAAEEKIFLVCLGEIDGLFWSCSHYDPLKGEMTLPAFVESEDDVKHGIVKEIKPVEYQYQTMERFSQAGDELVYAVVLTDFMVYGEKGGALQALTGQVEASQAFKPDNEGVSLEGYSKPWPFSFTSISDYAKCPFSYLIKHIYKIDDSFEDDLPMLEGNLLHKCMEDYYKKVPDMAFDRMAFEAGIDLTGVGARKSFYLYKVYLQASKLVNEMDNFAASCGFKQPETEKEFTSTVGKETLKGKIDAIFSSANGFMIIDYKTGNHEFNLDDAVNGFDMQLPLYALQETKDPAYKGKKLLGMDYVRPFSSDMLFTNAPSTSFSGYQVQEKTADGKSCKLVSKEASNPEDLAKYISSRPRPDLPDIDEIFKRVSANLTSISQGLETGKFPVTRKRFIKTDGTVVRTLCQFCPYEDCCQVDIDNPNEVKDLTMLKDESAEEE
jgi:hypothetical protein